jgi:hypothetical protein
MEVCVSEESNSPPSTEDHTSSTAPISSATRGEKPSVQRKKVVTRSGDLVGSNMNEFADLVHENFYRGPKIDDFDISDLR